MIPDFEAAYTGATGKGYRPAFEAVHMIEPRDPVVGSGVFFLR